VIPLKDNVTTGRRPVLTLVVIALATLAFAWQVALPSHEASSSELAAAHISKKNQLALERGAIPFRLAHPDSRCGALPEGIFCVSPASNTAAGPNGPPVPDDLDTGAWWLSPLTGALLSTDLLHLLVNLLFLWIFGRTLESTLGRGRYALLLVAATYVGAYATTLVDPGATGVTIGLAGALAGALGAYSVLHPRARVLTISVIPYLGTLLEVPAWLLVAAWFLIGLIPGLEQVVTPELLGDRTVAYVGYAGAFLFGVLAASLLTRFGSAGRARLATA
jgi:membrane associated rhomboid family serine protease